MVGTVRRNRRVLILANALLGVALAGGVPMLALAPVATRPPVAQESDAPAQGGDQPEAAPAKALDDYACIYRRPLRKPLFDVVAAPVAVAKSVMTVTAVGTVMEPGFTYAMLRDKAGRVHYTGVGEELDDVKVLVIAEGSVTVEFHGDRIELPVGKGGGR